MASKWQGKKYDVVVVGGGNAGLCAAISAREHGGKVLLLEKAPREKRGGNTYFTGFYRFTYKDLADVRKLVTDLSQDEVKTMDIDPYTLDDYYRDIMRISLGYADPELSQVLVNNARPTIDWLNGLGMKWEMDYMTLIKVGDRQRWQPGSAVMPKGGGAGIVDMLFNIAEKKGVEVAYETKAVKLMTDAQGGVCGLVVKTDDGLEELPVRAVILACGGFEANPEMRAKYLGPGWDTVKVRGTRYDTGEGLRMALEIGAKPTGQWTGCHSAQVDASAPDVEMGDAAFRPSYPHSIMVNLNAKRFVDEGEDFPLYTYVKIGKILLSQPRAWACQIMDQKCIPLLQVFYRSAVPVTANTIAELADRLGLDPAALVETVTQYNNAVQDGDFDPSRLDGKHTAGIELPKSNWALKIDTPPYIAYPVTTGITFTFGGVHITRYGQVLDTESNPIPGLYATGEIVGSFYHNYPGATGLMKGAVFGRLAGAHAMGQKLID